jgi:hypothetical protein
MSNLALAVEFGTAIESLAMISIGRAQESLLGFIERLVGGIAGKLSSERQGYKQKPGGEKCEE